VFFPARDESAAQVFAWVYSVNRRPHGRFTSPAGDGTGGAASDQIFGINLAAGNDGINYGFDNGLPGG